MGGLGRGGGRVGAGRRAGWGGSGREGAARGFARAWARRRRVEKAARDRAHVQTTPQAAPRNSRVVELSALIAANSALADKHCRRLRSFPRLAPVTLHAPRQRRRMRSCQHSAVRSGFANAAGRRWRRRWRRCCRRYVARRATPPPSPFGALTRRRCRAPLLVRSVHAAVRDDGHTLRAQHRVQRGQLGVQHRIRAPALTSLAPLDPTIL